jgi:Fe-S cluster biogenesis protein NfuA
VQPDRPDAPSRAAIEAAVRSVRPLLLGHGGDVGVVGVDDGIVTVAFRGACEACPNLAMTFVGPVRTVLMGVPGVREVRSGDVHASPRALGRIAAALGAVPVPADPPASSPATPAMRNCRLGGH